MSGISLILSLAVVVEAIVEYGKNICAAFVSKAAKVAVTQICAIVLSILLCMATGANLFDILGVTFFAPWVGVVLTGILGSRGANYVSDILSKMKK